MWKYGKDEDILAENAAQLTLNTCLKYNDYMDTSSDDMGSKENMIRGVNFIEKCKQKIDILLDEKIKDLKERADKYADRL